MSVTQLQVSTHFPYNRILTLLQIQKYLEEAASELEYLVTEELYDAQKTGEFPDELEPDGGDYEIEEIPQMLEVLGYCIEGVREKIGKRYSFGEDRESFSEDRLWDECKKRGIGREEAQTAISNLHVGMAIEIGADSTIINRTN